MRFIGSEELKNLDPEQICHLYALMSWNGKTFEEATQIVRTEKDLNGITYANDSIDSAINGIKSKLTTLQGRDENAKFDAVIEILSNIHDKWVEGNAKKYNRDSEAEGEKHDRRLFQHLPLAMIGLNETAQDMKFLAPFLNKIGLNIGAMKNEPYGAFYPSKEIQDAYLRHVSKFLQENPDLLKEESSITGMQKVLEGYAPLQNESSISKERLQYLFKEKTHLYKQFQDKMNEDSNFIRPEELAELVDNNSMGQ